MQVRGQAGQLLKVLQPSLQHDSKALAESTRSAAVRECFIQGNNEIQKDRIAYLLCPARRILQHTRQLLKKNEHIFTRKALHTRMDGTATPD